MRGQVPVLGWAPQIANAASDDLASRVMDLYADRDPILKMALAQGLVVPAHDYVLKCNQTFNILDARGAVGVTQRAEYINRIRGRVRACCLKHLEQYKQAAAK